MQKNVLEYLQATAARFPGKAAFSDEHEVMTFGGLDYNARAIGTYIAAHTTAINRPIVVLVERAASTIAAFMGVLYSGNYYVPLDSQMPLARILEIIAKLSPLFCVCSGKTKALADEISPHCPVIDIALALADKPCADLVASRTARILNIDPVYCIFTSGSTGTPKGIVISHLAVIDFTDWMTDTFPFSEADVMANQAPFFFDLSVKDIYTTLKCAATTHIAPRKILMFPIKLMEFIRDKNVTTLIWATAAFNIVANSGALEKIAPQSLNKIILGGEALFAKQLNIWRKALPDISYVNLYGPTEVTVDCTFYKIDRNYNDSEAVPIGYPCANKEVVLLDDNLQPVPAGEPGEICVRGAGLAHGYYGEAGKTAAVFVQNPANPWYPDVIYRTGDIGVLNDEGLLVYLCRRDGQIKRAGYRIELGEIETALSALPQMRELACFYDEDKDKIVCVYAGDIGTGDIVAGLKDVLPKYMFPNTFLPMESLPHNANGKIDRAKLRADYFDKT